jgi:molecular chaperone GrpE
MDLLIYENEQSLLPPRDLAAEIQRLQEELINERDKNLRTSADFKNYRSRIERDGNRIVIENKREILLSLLDIVDDLDKALKYASEAKQSFIEVLKIIHKKFLVLLEKEGVLPFESVGTPFNHNIHEAVAVAKLEDTDPGIVFDELRRGYLWNNELLRAAQVRVSG